ncbi:MAG TPA: hypothetical protein VFQ61_14685, partial [Polyangiaceae bacterium]|nr:hypothetical protein [Polyangiaceae bacterium]
MARFRGQALTVALLLATAGIWWTVNRHFPLPHWLLWGVLASWLASALWLASCAAVGWLVVQRLARDLGWLERLVIAIPLGVLTFAWCTFLLGLAGGLGRAAFFLLPALFLLTLATSTARRDLKRAYRHRRALFEHAPVLRSRLALAAIAFGTIGLLLTYVPILTPENIQHDARWYHLPIAQQYSSSGRIEPFAEGWILGTYPHLASLLYCWALTAPVGILGRLLLCAHLEYLLFLYTLAAIPVTIRALLGQRAFAGASWSWAAFFLYPGILVYDSNLSTGADHVAAIWAPAGLLLVLRLWTSADLRRRSLSRKAGLLGAVAGGAALTKYSAICAAAPLLIGLVWCCIRP